MSAKHGARTPNVVDGQPVVSKTVVTVSEIWEGREEEGKKKKEGAEAAAGSSSGGSSSSSNSKAAAAAPAQAIRFTKEDAQSKRQLIVRPGELNGGTCELVELEGCDVFVLDWSAQVTADRCRKCRIILGPVDGAVMLRECTELQVSAACRQLRCRECADCELRLFTLGPIIESSVRMAFGEWDASYPQLASHFAAAKLDPAAAHNKWAEVHDFNDPDKTADPPNWRLLRAEEKGGGGAGPWWQLAAVPVDRRPPMTGEASDPDDEVEGRGWVKASSTSSSSTAAAAPVDLSDAS